MTFGLIHALARENTKEKLNKVSGRLWIFNPKYSFSVFSLGLITKTLLSVPTAKHLEKLQDFHWSKDTHTEQSPKSVLHSEQITFLDTALFSSKTYQ